MKLIDAMNRRQKRITLFIHYWMDNHYTVPHEDKTEGEWLEEYDRWEHNVFTEDELRRHMPEGSPHY